jgi:hypothetical protein
VETLLLAPGTSLGPYTIIELVAVGGMGEVYRAEDSRLHRDVAIKVLPAHLAADRASLERFRREARAVAALSHPNILAIFDVGSADGVQFAVTELLEGENLRTRLSRGKLAAQEALALMLEIARGVAAAHERRIVHRDLKPENIFITRDGRVKVLDFGLARSSVSGVFEISDQKAPTEMLPTEPGVVLGTIGYLAPEQLEARGPTTATDVFALGCVLYEMIAGKVPFERASSAHAMVALLHDDAPRLQVDGNPLLRDIDALVQRCLEKDAHDRPQAAGELVAELSALHEGQRLSRRFRTTSRMERRSAPRVFAAALLLALVAATVFFIERTRHRQIDHGYDLRASDIRGDGETRGLIELALRADADGNRAKASELLEEAHRRGARTAFPAAFMASFNDSAGNFAVSREWAKLALQRLEGASTYESLLARYLLVPAGDRTRELALAISSLEVRPDAWRLRLAAAHIYLEQRDRDAARRELKQIDIHRPDDRRLMLVLADRASLGDIDGAERDLHASRLMTRPAFLHYTEARIAWSRGNGRLAATLYERAATDAAAEGLGPLEAEARLLAGIALLREGAWNEAQRHFAFAATRGRQLGLVHRVFDSSAFGAYAAHREGDSVERDRKLAAAMAVDPPAETAASLGLLALRLRSTALHERITKKVSNEPVLAASLILMRAREAWSKGDLETAKRELRRARAEGIDSTGDREEAELLASELGLPAQLLPADPPYPNSLRYLAIFELEDNRKANRESAPTPAR